MLSEATRKALFNEIHRSIHEAADTTVAQWSDVSLTYPPGVELTSDEKTALSALKLSDAAVSGLKKLVADACSYPLHHLFCLLDGVADPETDVGGVWLGATIADKSEQDDLMLHDELCESYWPYSNDGDPA